MRRSAFLTACGSGAAMLTLASASCSDAPTGRAAGGRSRDFVVEGKVLNQLWAPAAAGLRPVSTLERRTTVTHAGESVTVEGRDIAFRVADSTAPPATATPFGQTPGQAGSASRLVLKARRVATHPVEGKRMTLSIVPDADRRSGRPARAMLMVVDDRIAAITEYTWARKAGSWRAIRSRTTFFDANGRVSLVSDQDASSMESRSSASADAVKGPVRRAGQLLAAAGRIVQPDALYAATEEELCIKEGLAAAAAAAVVIGAGYWVTSATAALSAATAALTAAMAGCMAGTITCPALEAAVVAEAVAAANLRQAQSALAAALTAAAAADYALSECLNRQRERQQDPADGTVTGPSGSGSEGICGEGEEEWCEWTLSWPDGVLHVQRNYCWCEGEYAL